MDRLTTRNMMGVAVFKEGYECDVCSERIHRLPDYGNGSPTDKLAEYEEAEESGRWVKMPVGLNERLYYPTVSGIVEADVKGVEFTSDTVYIQLMLHEGGGALFVEPEDIGVTVFKTVEEAKKKFEEKYS